jgi:pilus assembly protein Flp/PilA
MNLRRLLGNIGQDNSGSTAIEYGLIAALVVIACIASFQSVADANTGLWAVVSSKVTGVMGD